VKLKRVCDGKNGIDGVIVCDKSMNNNGIHDDKLRILERISINKSIISEKYFLIQCNQCTILVNVNVREKMKKGSVSVHKICVFFSSSVFISPI
jgi:hypothetical protein